MTDFSVEVRRLGEVPYRIVGIGGELGLPDVDGLGAILDDAGADEASVVIDLGACEFIDSMALAALMRAHKQFAETGRRLVIAGPTAQVRRVLDISGLALDGLVYADVEAALSDR